jgi:biopolymer transport protein ExbD
MKMQTRRPKEDPEINLISLIDIALLLVIFFMLTSTFMQEGASRSNSQASLAPTASRSSIRSSSPSPRAAAIARMTGSSSTPPRHAARGHPGSRRCRSDKPVTCADGRATHQSVVSAMDVLGKLGFVRLNIATVEDSSPRNEADTAADASADGLSPVAELRAASPRHVHDRCLACCCSRPPTAPSCTSCRSSSRA